MDVTTKPLVFDADNGGQLEHLPFLIRSLERSGVSAIIMEDKIGLKKIHFLKIRKIQNKISQEHFAKRSKKFVKLEDLKILWSLQELRVLL